MISKKQVFFNQNFVNFFKRRFEILILFIPELAVQAPESEVQECLTTDEPGDVNIKNAPCQFPFTHNEQTFYSCTTESDPNGRFWCSTDIDESGKHIDGNWGYCSEECYS